MCTGAEWERQQSEQPWAAGADLSSGQSQHLCLIFTEPGGAPTLTALGQGRTYPVSRWGLHQSKSTLFPKVAGQQDDSVTKEGRQGGKVSRPGK